MPIETLIDAYCEVWSDPDAVRRSNRLAALWAPGATYADSTVDALDGPALLEHIARVQRTRPGARVVRSTAVDSHHGIARFGFRVIGPDGTLLREGMDIAFLSRDASRIERVVGFFGVLE